MTCLVPVLEDHKNVEHHNKSADDPAKTRRFHPQGAVDTHRPPPVYQVPEGYQRRGTTPAMWADRSVFLPRETHNPEPSVLDSLSSYPLTPLSPPRVLFLTTMSGRG